MSDYFEKNVFVHERGTDGNILPVDITVKIKGKKGKIKVKPMLSGEIAEMRNNALSVKELAKTEPEKAKILSEKNGRDIIKKHILNPKFEDDDFEFLKPKETNKLLKAIMIANGFEEKELESLFKKALQESGDNPQ